jgi:5'-3' exonuclease
MKKYTLLIDGNYFLFRTLYVIPPAKKGQQALSTEKEIGVYLRKLATDFASEIRKFKPFVDEIVFTLDSKSWRKDFYPDADYKGNRKADSNIHWENFKAATSEFRDVLEKRGVTIHKMEGAEGDDLIYAWSNYLNLDGKNTIVFSGDRDLMQLVSHNKSTGGQTLFYSGTHKRICVPTGFLDWIEVKEDVDIFNLSSTVHNKIKEDLHNFIISSNLSIDEMDADTYVFAKILTGDSGDNIKSVYYYNTSTKNGTRTYGITDKKAQCVVSAFVKKFGGFNKSYVFDDSYQKEICKLVIKDLNATKMPYDTILENIKINSNLIVLSSLSIPHSIHNMMFEEIEKLDQGKNTVDFESLSKMEKLLHGTKHSKGVNTSGFFDDDTNEDLSFIKKKNNTSPTF